MFTLIKWGAIIIVILIALNIWAPGAKNNITNTISENTGIEKSLLDDKLNQATGLVKDQAEDLKSKVSDKIDEVSN